MKRAWFVIWILLAAIALPAPHAASGAVTVGGGGSQEVRASTGQMVPAPVWFSAETLGGVRINLVLAGSEPGTFILGPDVARAPVAISSSGARTVMVFETPGGSRPVRQGVAEFGPGRRLVNVDLRALASLPGDGALAGVVSTPTGEFALLLDMQFPLEGESREAFEQGPALLRLSGDGWARQALPEGLDPANRWRLIAIDQTPAIVEHTEPGRARLWLRDQDGSWNAQIWAIPGDAREMIGVSGGVLVERPDAGDAVFEFVRGEAALPRGRIESPPADRAWAPLGDRIVMIGVDRTGESPVLWSAVIGADQSTLHAGTLRPVSPISRRDVETLIVLIASAALTTILFLLRIGTAGQGVVLIPEGSSLAPTWKRGAAVLMDLAPALALVMWLWPMPENGSSMADLTMAYGPWPPLTVAGLVIAHSAICEWLFGRTLGKALAGCRTISVRNGKKPTFAQAMGRNFVKIACPPLGMVQAMTPGRPEPWGFGTTVIVPAPPGDRPASE